MQLGFPPFISYLTFGISSSKWAFFFVAKSELVAKGKDLLGLELFLEWLLPAELPVWLAEKEVAVVEDLMEDEVSSVNPLTRRVCAVFKKDDKHSLSTETSPWYMNSTIPWRSSYGTSLRTMTGCCQAEMPWKKKITQHGIGIIHDKMFCLHNCVLWLIERGLFNCCFKSFVLYNVHKNKV